MAYVTSIWTVQNYGHGPLFCTVQKNGCGLFKLLFGTVILDRQKLQKQKEILTHLDPCGAIKSYLKPLGAIWSHLGAIWSSLEQFGAIWTSLLQFKAIWSHLEPIGATWSHLEPFGAI